MQPAHPTSPSSVAGFAVPVGANVLLSPYALHRDPDVFTDPKVFDPDRWRPERVTAAQRQAFIASGGGRRKCLGEFYGMPEAHLALAAISGRCNCALLAQGRPVPFPGSCSPRRPGR
ncbi:cytochrome P450 [Streptomyces sp. NPDC048256]|uniref:cytochrome P450 n=1 Tax=Streptomyces sp. NPDC048256 TaxID=3154613 RepID=UPI0033D52D9C